MLVAKINLLILTNHYVCMLSTANSVTINNKPFKGAQFKTFTYIYISNYIPYSATAKSIKISLGL